jgi:hypothetical protein
MELFNQIISNIQELKLFKNEWFADPEKVKWRNSKSKYLNKLFRMGLLDEVCLNQLYNEMISKNTDISVRITLASYLMEKYREESLDVYFEALAYTEHKAAARARLFVELGEDKFKLEVNKRNNM